MIFEEILSSFLLTEEKTDVKMIHDAQLIKLVNESTTDRRFSFKSLRLSDADAWEYSIHAQCYNVQASCSFSRSSES